MNAPENKNTLLKSKEVLEYLRISRSTLRQWIENGELPAFKVGGNWRFHFSDVQAKVVVQSPQASQQQPELNWRDYRMMRYVNALVESEQPPNDEERQRMRDEWYALGEDAVVEAMRYLRRKIKQQRDHVGREYDHAANE